MRKKPQLRRVVSKELSPAEIDKTLLKIAKLIHAKRKSKSNNRDNFAYEVNVSRSAMQRYEAGADMYLSTFLKLLYGLDATPEEFFKELK